MNNEDVGHMNISLKKFGLLQIFLYNTSNKSVGCKKFIIYIIIIEPHKKNCQLQGTTIV